MGGDRCFYSNSTDGFFHWQCDKKILLPGESAACHAKIFIPFTGRYFLQFSCDYALRVKWGGNIYRSGTIPMLHNEIREIPYTLEKGVQEIIIELVNPSEAEMVTDFSGRFLD